MAWASHPLLLFRLAKEDSDTMAYELPPLPYDYTALEPHIDEQTMHLHHDKHHQAYVNNVNTALQGQSQFENMSVDDLMRKLNSVPENIRTAVRNNGGGHANHRVLADHEAWGWWRPDRRLERAIERDSAALVLFKRLSRMLRRAFWLGLGVAHFGQGWQARRGLLPQPGQPDNGWHLPLLGLMSGSMPTI